MDCKYCNSSDIDHSFDDGIPCYRCNDCGESWEPLEEYPETEQNGTEWNKREYKR